MKEGPISFSAPMVPPMLADIKTITRRVIKPSNSVVEVDRKVPWSELNFDAARVCNDLSPAGNSGPYLSVPCPHYGIEQRVYPRWQPGQRLWVRERWAAPHACDHLPPRLIPPGTRIHYLATETWDDHGGLRKRPSIFMPRWASRITLEITGVRPERLQDISENDAMNEGVRCDKNTIAETGFATYRDVFRSLWGGLNGPDSWDANPLVWVIEFRRKQAATCQGILDN